MTIKKIVGQDFDLLLFLFPGIVGILPDGKFPLGEYIGLNPALNLVGHTWITHLWQLEPKLTCLVYSSMDLIPVAPFSSPTVQ